MTRLPPLDPETLSPRQREVYQAILGSARHSVEGPLRAWLASPELADRAQSLGLKCRFGSSLAPTMSELAILVVAAYWKSEFEWHAHAPLALQAGLSAAFVDAVRRDRDGLGAAEGDHEQRIYRGVSPVYASLSREVNDGRRIDCR